MLQINAFRYTYGVAVESEGSRVGYVDETILWAKVVLTRNRQQCLSTLPNVSISVNYEE